MGVDLVEDDPYAWGNSPFNGQEERVSLFRQLTDLVEIRAVVETGTFRGATTLFFHECTKVDVYSCELSGNYYDKVLSRLTDYEKIHLYNEDSRVFLRKLASTPDMPRENVFFYLDAHWNTDLPLPEELAIIYQNFVSPLIMIDDFEVSHRDDFGFDDYGENAILSLDIIKDVLKNDLWLFYPNWRAGDVQAPNRGFVILADGETAEKMKVLSPSLYPLQPMDAALTQMKRYRRMYRSAIKAE
jgi:hypothetical protein